MLLVVLRVNVKKINELFQFFDDVPLIEFFLDFKILLQLITYKIKKDLTIFFEKFIFVSEKNY